MHPELLGEHQHYVVGQNLMLACEGSKDAAFAGWGGIDPIFKPAEQAVTALAQKHLCPLHCLGKTMDGQPRHPLYLPKDAEREEFFAPILELMPGFDAVP